MGSPNPVSDARSRLGRAGEDTALAWYLGIGFELVARNWRCAAGELDLVLVRDGVLVFCEVKTRTGDGFGGGYEAVGWRKKRKLRQLAELFLAARGVVPAVVRFDVASVMASPGAQPTVEVFQDAF